MASSSTRMLLLSLALCLPGCDAPPSGEAGAVAAERPSPAPTPGAKVNAPAPAFPFAGRAFRRDETGYGGSARITGSGEALRLVIALSFRGRPSCDLDGALAATPAGYAVQTQDGPALVLRAVSRTGFDLAYADSGHQPYQVDYCTLGTSIDGHYTLAANGDRTDDAMTDSSYPTCDDVRRAVASGEDAYDILGRHYPAALVDPKTVDDTPLDAAGMEALMRFTACTVHAARGDGALSDQLLALFKSRRHADAATSALARIGRGTGAEADAARALADQMRGYAAGPNG